MHSFVGLFGVHGDMTQTCRQRFLMIFESISTPPRQTRPEPDGSEMTRPALGAWHPGCSQMTKSAEEMNGK